MIDELFWVEETTKDNSRLKRRNLLYQMLSYIDEGWDTKSPKPEKIKELFTLIDPCESHPVYSTGLLRYTYCIRSHFPEIWKDYLDRTYEHLLTVGRNPEVLLIGLL